MTRFYIIWLLFFFLVSHHGLTQERTPDDDRTLETKIADLLNEMPAGSIEEKDALMEDMIGLGEEGIVEFSKLLAPPKTGGDSLVRYALGSVTKYATGGKGGEHRGMVSRALLTSLEKENNTGIKKFLIEQLEIVGENEAVSALAGYLDDPELCDRAAMALVEIGTPKAEEVLGEALESSDETVLLAVTNALGELQTQNHLDTFENFVREYSGNLRKVSLRALARSGSPEAKDVLLEAARDNNFKYSRDNAVSSLLHYLGRLGVRGHMETMESLCYTIIDESDDRELVHIRTQALNILVTYSKNEAIEAVMNALESPYREYRRAALSFTEGLQGEHIRHRLMNAYDKYDHEVKAEIIHAFAERGDVSAIPLIEDALEHENQTVRRAAIPALAKLAREKAVPGLAGILQSGRPAEIKLAKEALMTIAPEHFLPELTDRYKGYSTRSKTVVLELIGTRQADQYNKMVLKEATGSSDQTIRLTAWNTLEKIAKPEDMDEVLESFSQAEQDEELGTIGDVIQSMIIRSDKQDTLIARVRQNMQEASLSKQKEYLDLFPEIGSPEAIDAVMDIYEKGSPELKMAAVQTLNQWENTKALDALYKIVDTEDSRKLRTTAFDGSLGLISETSEPAVQKLLYYRELMPVTRTNGEKKEIISRIGKLGIFPAVTYCGEYLDDSDLSAVAAKAIVNTVIPADDPKEGMTGEYVRKLLEKASEALSEAGMEEEQGKIAEYLKQMPDKNGFYPLFNGKDLSGWKGLVGDPVSQREMSEDELRRKQKEANQRMRKNWKVKDGVLVFTGEGKNIATEEDFRNFEMYVDWKIEPEGDGGIYLRGTPQVQIWDTSRTEVGAEVGSGGLYNNEDHQSTPLVVADNPVGEWNTFRIKMIGNKVSVWLNGEQVVDNVVMENYWEREKPIYPEGPIEIQAHGTKLYFRDIFVRELPSEDHNQLTSEEKQEGFVRLFNGNDLQGWVGDKSGYVVNNGRITF
ncbi:MAG: family 16 glycoside hydrolase, partial [Bacteroidota bacterium]